MTILEQNESEQAYSAGRHDAREEAQAEIDKFRSALDKSWERNLKQQSEIDEQVNMLLYCNPVPAKKTQYEALMDKYKGNVMIPKILHEASRQYRHNNSTQLSKFEELVSGFDQDETIKIVTGLQAEIDDQTKQIHKLTTLLDEQYGTPCEQIRHQSEIDELQAKIDRLMLEFCPDEMTREQLSRWGECQKPVDKHKEE